MLLFWSCFQLFSRLFDVERSVLQAFAAVSSLKRARFSGVLETGGLAMDCAESLAGFEQRFQQPGKLKTSLPLMILQGN